MHTTPNLEKYNSHKNQRYFSLVEESNNFKYIDESVSDQAAFKALKLLNKINKIKYLTKQFSI